MDRVHDALPAIPTWLSTTRSSSELRAVGRNERCVFM